MLSGCLCGLRSENSGKSGTLAGLRNFRNSLFDKFFYGFLELICCFFSDFLDLLNRSFFSDLFDCLFHSLFDLFNWSFLSDLIDCFFNSLFELLNRSFLGDLIDSLLDGLFDLLNRSFLGDFFDCLFDLFNRRFFNDRLWFSDRFRFRSRSRCFRFRFCRLESCERGEGVEVYISETCIDLFFERIVDLVFRHAAEVILFGIHRFQHVRLCRSTFRFFKFRRLVSGQRIIFREGIEIIVALGICLNARAFRNERIVDRLVHSKSCNIIRELCGWFIIRIVL